MAKSKEQTDLELIIKNSASNARTHKKNASNYDVGYMLTDEQIKFSTAYEVAKRLGIPLLKAYQQYNLQAVALASIEDLGLQEGVIEEARTSTTPGKPTIIFVNYRINNSEDPTKEALTGAMHWAPVIVTKNEAGQFSVTQLNSSTNKTFKTSEIETFVDKLGQALGSNVAKADASRDVQISNVCGLASASASGIALGLLSKGAKLESTAFEGLEQDKLSPSSDTAPNMQEIPYCVQGRKTFAVMEHLAKHPKRIGWDIEEVEKRALVESGILTEAQISDPARIDTILKEREELRFELDKTLRAGAIEGTEIQNITFTRQEKDELINRYITKYTTPKGFDRDRCTQDMQGYIVALQLQAEELGFRGKEKDKVSSRAIQDELASWEKTIEASRSQAGSKERT